MQAWQTSQSWAGRGSRCWALALLWVGCVGPSKEIGVSATTVGSSSASDGDNTSSSGMESSSTAMGTTAGEASSSATTTTSNAESSSEGASETTAGLPTTCEAAQSEAECSAVDSALETCAWVPTIVVAGGTCDVVETGFEGECVLASAADGCQGAGDSTCPDGLTRVYFNLLGLEIGAVELVALDDAFECEGAAAGFEPCMMIPGDPVTYEPPECGCACAQ